MKKIGTLNNRLSKVIAEMGHTDMLAIADAGLPIPQETERIDLALSRGVPGFIQTLQTVVSELEIEEIILAEEIKSATSSSAELFERLQGIVGDVPITFVSHEDFKQTLPSCRAVVRTGECTPYANIIMSSGVKF